jgi:hypothetical protein
MPEQRRQHYLTYTATRSQWQFQLSKISQQTVMYMKTDITYRTPSVLRSWREKWFSSYKNLIKVNKKAAEHIYIYKTNTRAERKANCLDDAVFVCSVSVRSCSFLFGRDIRYETSSRGCAILYRSSSERNFIQRISRKAKTVCMLFLCLLLKIQQEIWMWLVAVNMPSWLLV